MAELPDGARKSRGDAKPTHGSPSATIPVVIASVAVLVGLADLPYGYYMLLRIILCGVSSFLLLGANLDLQPWHRWMLVGCALLYNPFFPVRLGEKTVWIVLNLLTVSVFWSASQRAR